MQLGAVDRRTFLGQAAALTSALALSREATASSEIDIEEATLADLGEKMASGAD